ncbi:MAG: D-alanyl-D-alanine carboxypeptidase/D-alanyl-D-alanine-endopeptidase [Gallionella sp.]|jgi:D-alanyl-D-alanine carboxypeptidase/D-alanyl-D-alanine-endopeptidase (penicillin-binding protein 4)
MKAILTVLLLVLGFNTQATPLPESVVRELQKASIPTDAIAIEVRELGKSSPLISHNAHLAMNPASTMKLLTTYAGLQILGPAYRWKTEVYLDGKLENGVLYGNVIFKGYGDPKLTIETFWLWLHELRQRGLREIRGDVVLDSSFFANENYTTIDNKPARAYNVAPNGLLLNFNALHLRLLPNGEKTTALLEPELQGYQLDNRITTSNTLPCHREDAYQSRLAGHTIVLEGQIPALCGEAQDYFSLLPHNAYFFAVFSALWQELGGQVQGQVRTGRVPESLSAFSTHLSPPLSEVIRDINKFSNNTMARQLFLTLGTNDSPVASIARSTGAVAQWLKKQQLQFPELALENGAGLSRTERISARHLADILQNASNNPLSAELEASLPILGMDGTVKSRFKEDEIAGHAHLKTGSLEGVKSIAGYVHAGSGKRWIMVFIINHPNAALGQPAQDALIEWLQKAH